MEMIPTPLTREPLEEVAGLLVKLPTRMVLPSSLTSTTSLDGRVMLYSVNIRTAPGSLPMLSDTSKVALVERLLELSIVTFPLDKGLPPSGGNTIDPFAPEMMLPKCISVNLVMTIGETTMQVIFA